MKRETIVKYAYGDSEARRFSTVVSRQYVETEAEYQVTKCIYNINGHLI